MAFLAAALQLLQHLTVHRILGINEAPQVKGIRDRRHTVQADV